MMIALWRLGVLCADITCIRVPGGLVLCGACRGFLLRRSRHGGAVPKVAVEREAPSGGGGSTLPTGVAQSPAQSLLSVLVCRKGFVLQATPARYTGA